MMINVRYFILLFLYLIVFSANILAQHSIPDTVRAMRITEPIRLDGILEEECWKKADKIHNFTQRELDNGKPATERTEVAMVYTTDCLYIGLWCYDTNPEAITAKSWERDFQYWTDDNFEIAFDTYKDKRNGYVFVINPNGARADVQISDDGRGFNIDWNGVWDAETVINRDGWFAEIKIPFSTLKYPEKLFQTWGINFERNIRSKRESDFWQGWSRDRDFENVSQAGTLTGLEKISGKETLELKPFITAGFSSDSTFNSKFKFGGDINYLITPTIKLNLTANTDFAQVESDRMRINLTRFSLYYPEKRDFFLEGEDAFEVRYYDSEILFYSRRIGIQDGKEVPILAGAKIIGKTDRTSINLLSIQTGSIMDIQSTNYSVIRINRDVFEKSNLGMILTAKNSKDNFNYVYGLDYQYNTSNFLTDKNLMVLGSLSQSQTKGTDGLNNLSYRIGLLYPNDLITFQSLVLGVQKNFNPEMGFLERRNYDLVYGELMIRPLVGFIPGIRKLIFKPFKLALFYNDETRMLETGYLEIRPLSFELTTGDIFEFNIEQNFDRIYVGYNIFKDIYMKSGIYRWNRYNFRFTSYEGRKITTFIEYYFGDFYNGTNKNLNATVSWALLKHIRLSADYYRNMVRLPQGNFTTDDIGGRIEYGFNPKLFSSIFCQWNNQMEEILLNLRIHWIPVVGSDFYLALNQSLDTRNKIIKLSNTTILTKFVWRIGI